MTEEIAQESQEFDMEFKIRLPRQVAKRLLFAAEARRVDAGPLAAAIVAKAFGAEVTVPPARVPRKAKFSDPAVRADIRTMHAAGLTVSEIALNLDVKRSTAVDWCVALELDVGRARRTSGQRASSLVKAERSERFKRLAAQRDGLEAAS